MFSIRVQEGHATVKPILVAPETTAAFAHFSISSYVAGALSVLRPAF